MWKLYVGATVVSNRPTSAAAFIGIFELRLPRRRSFEWLMRLPWSKLQMY
jgi:hypothetical protein